MHIYTGASSGYAWAVRFLLLLPSVLGYLLPDFAGVIRRTELAAAAEGVDVEAAAPGIAGVNSQRLGVAVALDVAEEALDALLVEFVVLAEGDDIAQEPGAVDGLAAIAYD